jgi:lysophospholipase
MFNASDGGIQYTWSSIAETQDFIDGNYPLPLVVADGRNPGEKVVGSNSTVYEFNPWEFGTFDPTIFGFAPLKYLGSRFVGGSLPSNESCIGGFDSAGFIIGTSSTLFNQFLLQLNTTSLPTWAKNIFTDILEKLDKADQDIASYDPNPFYHYNNDSSPYALQTELDVVDGGEDLQNIPLHPLIQPVRNVDVIFAVDSSADTTYSWPNGTALVATYQRSLNSSGIGNGTVFPTIPDQNTFVNLGLNTRPTFFGCNSSNLTGPAPLVVYVPNYPYSAMSNVSTFDLSYNDTQRDDIILNGYEVATMANSTRDGNWTACVGCAILARSFERTGTTLPSICTQCFSNYCWNGTVNSTEPNAFEPTTLISVKSSGAGALLPTLLTAAMASGVALFAFA